MKKVIVCGPPHSGKSVFLANIMAKIPCDQYILIYGCPDGEGHWSNIANQNVAQAIRQKGVFDATFLNFITKSIRNAEQRLVLVDVGGRRSSENEIIFRECEGYIILSSSPEEISAWRQFGDGLGLQCLAELDSRLSTEESVLYPNQGDGILRGLVVGLERGTFVNSVVIDVLVKRFKAIITANSQMTLAEKEADISGIQLADKIGIEDRTDPFLGYRPWHLMPALKAVKRLYSKKIIRIWNIRSFWTASAMVIAFQKSLVELFDVSNGYIAIPSLKPKKSGSEIGIDWRVNEFDDFTIVNFRINGDIFDISTLRKVYPPAVNQAKGVIISGRGPIVLGATIARAYSNGKHPFIAMFAAAESGRKQLSLNGQKWDEVYPVCGPCVEIAGQNIGRLIPVNTENLKFEVKEDPIK